MDIRSIAVVGSGQMGSGIAQVSASSGFTVKIFDALKVNRDSAVQRINQGLQKLVEKKKLTPEEAAKAGGNVSAVERLEDFRGTDLVIEAISEDFSAKAELFRRLDDICGDSTVFATNTSSISISKIAGATKRPERVVGLHFMNPVPVMKLVELIRGLQTSDGALLSSRQVAEKMGKTCVLSNDFPGFIVNRVLMPMINEACYAVFESLASPKDIDAAMKLGTNQPMGPLELADFIGLDTCLAILSTMFEGFGDPKFRPCPILKQYVAAGRLGKKTGRGFYSYG